MSDTKSSTFEELLREYDDLATRVYLGNIVVARDAVEPFRAARSALVSAYKELEAKNAELRRRSSLPSLVQAKRIAELEVNAITAEEAGDLCEVIEQGPSLLWTDWPQIIVLYKRLRSISSKRKPE